jgi:hypothetical protein
VVDDPATGRLFPVRDVGALVAALRAALAPGALRPGAARARAEAEFDESAVVARVLAAYSSPRSRS